MIRYEDADQELKKMIIASVVFHVAIFLVFTVKTAFFPSDIPEYQAAIRVDLVGLPDKRSPEKPVVAPKPEEPKAPPTPPKETKAPPEKTPPAKAAAKKDTAASQAAALNRLKSLSAIEKVKNMEASKKEDASAEPEVIKGNIISPGTSLRGLNRIEFDHYIGSLDAHVKNNWALPEWMLSQNLRAEVYVRVDKTGQLVERRLAVKSGNSEFDQRVMEALERSNPFPPPPEKFIDLVGIQGITFAFPE